MEKRYKHLSLFSGCGGMDIGFEGGFKCLKKSINSTIHPEWIEKDWGNFVQVKKTEFETVFANDIRADAKAAWVSYFSKIYKNANDLYHLESIVNLVKKSKSKEFTFPSNIDVVTGGFPCQDFSIAGKRKGFNSDKNHKGTELEIDSPTEESRGQLYIWMREVISIVEPKMFIAENVKGIISLDEVKAIIEKDFSNASKGGYIVIPARVLHVANYGVPQSRERVIFYGFKKSSLKPEALAALSNIDTNTNFDPYPPSTHSYNVIGNGAQPFVTSADVLIDLAEPEHSDDISQTKYSKAKYLPKGQGNIEVKLDSVAPTIRAEHHGNIEFRRLNVENGGKYIEELDRGLQQRRLTIRECARLQTFPDDYNFIIPKSQDNVAVSASNAYKLIGNAVPCILGYNIAMHLSKKWDQYFI